MSLFIRPANFPDDYQALAQLLTAEAPDWPTTPEELAFEDATHDPALYRLVLLAETILPDGQRSLVGIARIDQDSLAYQKDNFLLDIRVHPDLQEQGIGRQLYLAILTRLEPLKPYVLQTEVWEAHPRAVRFVTDRGFVEVWRRLDSILPVSQFDLEPYAGLEERLKALSIEIKTFAALANDPARIEKLYHLDWALWQDIPYGETLTQRSLAQFAQEELQGPGFVPAALFIAVHQDDFVCYSKLKQGDNYYIVEMTGVLKPYRGHGLATLLKLRGIQYAQMHGNFVLRTVNDSTNIAMLALNTKLGFQPQGATIRFQLIIS